MDFSHRREIVAAMINDMITTDLDHMRSAIQLNLPIQWLDRMHMEMMARLDLGPAWGQLAAAPTIFWVNQDGSFDELSGIRLHVRRRGEARV